MLEILLLVLVLGVIGATFVGSFEMIGNYRQKPDIFRVHKNVFNTLRKDNELTLIGAIIPLIIITPFLIPAMLIVLLTILLILIKRAVVKAYCTLFKRKDKSEE